MEQPSQERRRFARIPFTAPVIVVQASEVRTLPARDICPGGIFLAAREAPAVGTALRLELDLALGRRFELDGCVVRRVPEGSSEPGFAVRFELSPEQQHAVVQTLAGS